jgi:uncharacterized protein
VTAKRPLPAGCVDDAPAKQRGLRLASTILLLALTACGTPPQEHFFTLASEPAQRASATPAYTVIVGPVTIPELVDRPQMVIRTSPTRVEIAELARWAAPLKSEIPRVIGDHLARLLDDARVSTSSERAAGTADYRVILDVQRFESAPRESATIQVAWTVRSRDGAAVSGQSVATETAAPGYDALVAAHSRALERVSREIAAAIVSARM